MPDTGTTGTTSTGSMGAEVKPLYPQARKRSYPTEKDRLEMQKERDRKRKGTQR